MKNSHKDLSPQRKSKVRNEFPLEICLDKSNAYDR